MTTKIPQNQLADINVTTVDPTVTDDASARWGIGSKWLNKTSNALFICTDPTIGAAVWLEIGGSGGGAGVFNNGSATKDTTDVSGVQIIPHELGVVPSFVRISGVCVNLAQYGAVIEEAPVWTEATYDGTTQNAIASITTWGGSFSIVSFTNSFTLSSSGGGSTPFRQVGVITWDATNIYITWTQTGTGGTGIYDLIWEAVGAGGASGLYSVNADEKISTWFTTTIPSPRTSTGAPTWVYTNSPSVNVNGNFSTFQKGSGGAVADALIVPQASTSKGMRLKFLAKMDVALTSGDLVNMGYQLVYFGLTASGLSAVSNGSSTTTTPISGITVTDWNLYEIVFNPGGTSIDYYVNGILKTSITTNLPTTPLDRLEIEGNTLSSGAILSISDFINSQEL